MRRIASFAVALLVILAASLLWPGRVAGQPVDGYQQPEHLVVSIAGSAGPDTSVEVGTVSVLIEMQARTVEDVIYAYRSGDIAAGRYWTIRAGAAKQLGPVTIPGGLLYMRSADAGGATVEVELLRQ